MLYEITGQGMKRIDISGKNSLPIGTVLHLNGYSDPDYVIVKNLGIDPKWAYYGAKYTVISLDDFGQSIKNASDLRFISEKKDDRIQTYITDIIKDSDFVIDLWQKSEAKRLKLLANQNQLQAKADELETKGRELFKKHIPETAKALIVAVCDSDESDSMTDYFAHNTTDMVILGWSAHTRDLFSEMRKHAIKFPETKHLGPGKGHFEIRVYIGADIHSNGSYYNKGQCSHWHRDLTEKNGYSIVFQTKEEAQAHIDRVGAPESITFDGVLIPFYWGIEEDEIEHREKWSMGSGYYLKDGGSHSSGWRVEKTRKGSNVWSRDLYIAMAKRCVF